MSRPRPRFLLALLLPLATHAWAPLRDGEGAPLAWAAESFPLPLAEGGAAWSRAAARWTALADVGFTPRDASRRLGPDGVVALDRVTEPERWQTLVGDPGLVGFTLVTSRGGALVDADVVLNVARFELAGAPGGRTHVLETVVAHELGHVLGLGHPCGEAGQDGCFELEPADPRLTALMFPSISPGELRLPGTDDLDGLAVVVPEIPVRRPVLGEARWLGGDDWSLSSAPHRLRLRAGEELVPVVVEGDRVRASGAPPFTIELWSAEGQGVVGEDHLRAEPADAGADASGEGRETMGCSQAPGVSAILWCLLLLPRRRR